MTTITLYEPTVDALIADGWIGLRLTRSATEDGTYSTVVDIPYVAGQEQYVYEDTASAATDWYRTMRYSGGATSAVSNPFPARPGTTLAKIRQGAVRAVSGYDGLLVSTASATSTTVLEDTKRLKSSSVRGRSLDGAWVYRPAAALASDRVRMVADGGYDTTAGRVTPDLVWTNAVQTGETYEVILGANLHPTDSIHPAIRTALMRTRFADTVHLIDDNASTSTDLTLRFPWLTSSSHLRSVGLADTDGNYSGHHHMHHRPYARGGHLWITVDEASGHMNLEVLRPHGTLVNEQDSLSGPTSDGDTVRCPLDWAIAGTVVELYKMFGPMIGASEGTIVSKAMAQWAAEFSRLSMLYVRQDVQPRQAISMSRVGVGARNW